MSTKNNVGSFNCYEKAHPDEPMFVLLGRDPTAPLIVLAWVVLRHHCGHNDSAQLEEAIQCAQDMQAWAAKLGKTPILARARQKAASLLIHYASEIITDALALAIEERLGDVPV
jgi:hypothetical protein